MYFILIQNSKIEIKFYISKKLILDAAEYQYSEDLGKFETMKSGKIKLNISLKTLEMGKYFI